MSMERNTTEDALYRAMKRRDREQSNRAIGVVLILFGMFVVFRVIRDLPDILSLLF